MTTRSEPLAVEEFDVKAEPPAARGPWRLLIVAAVVAAVAGFALISHDDGTTPGDTPISTVAESTLGEPSREEIAAASNAGVYQPGTGPTEVTFNRSYVSLRRCAIGNEFTGEPCDGSNPMAASYISVLPWSRPL